MTITILKRTRVDTSSPWSAWAATTDVAPFVDTSTVEYMVDGDVNITIDQLTNGNLTSAYEWDGTGVFDVLMKAVNSNIEAQYKKDRITGDDYAKVYLGAIQSVIQQSIQFLLQEPLLEAQTESEIAKQALIARQTQGFDDDAKQKLLKQIMDSWSVAYSVAQDANSIPDAIKVNPIDSVAKNIMDTLGVVKTNDPLGEP